MKESNIFIIRDSKGRYLQYWDMDNDCWFFPNTSLLLPSGKLIIEKEVKKFSWEHKEKRDYLIKFKVLELEEYIESYLSDNKVHRWFFNYEIADRDDYERNKEIVDIVLSLDDKTID